MGRQLGAKRAERELGAARAEAKKKVLEEVRGEGGGW